MSNISRIGVTHRWSDIVVYRGIARWVEVAEEPAQSFAQEVEMVLRQMGQRLTSLGTDRTSVLQVLIFVTDLSNVEELNKRWDVWFPSGSAPVRACVQAKLQSTYRIELVIEAAVPDVKIESEAT